MMAQRAPYLVERLLDALDVARRLRLEAQGEGIADPSRADLLSAIDVEQPQVGQQRPGAHAGDAQELADRGRLVDDHRQVAIDRLGGGDWAGALLSRDEVEQAPDVDRRVDRPPGQAPGLDHLRVNLS